METIADRIDITLIEDNSKTPITASMTCERSCLPPVAGQSLRIYAF